MTRRVPEAAIQVPGLVSGVLLVLGAWLLVFSVTGVYGADSGFDAPWGARLAGTAAVALGLVRVTRRIRLGTASAASAGLGLWLLVSPFVLNYGFGVDTALAMGVDAAAGVVVLALAGLEILSSRPAG